MHQLAAKALAGVWLAAPPEQAMVVTRMAGNVLYSVADIPQHRVAPLNPNVAIFPVGNLPMIALLARIRARVQRDGYSAPSNRDFVREGRDGDLFGNGDKPRHD